LRAIADAQAAIRVENQREVAWHLRLHGQAARVTAAVGQPIAVGRDHRHQR
jgi:hypothetical protein